VDICAGCKKKIEDGRILTALEQQWHGDCFKCAQCQKPVTGGSFAVDDANRPVCLTCAEAANPGGSAPKTCESCSKSIEGEYMSSPNGGSGFMHPNCFKCDSCHLVIDGAKGFAKQGDKFVHPACAQKQGGGTFGDACGLCNKPLGGSCVTANKKSFHKECFHCFTCKGDISTSFFLDDNGHFLCASCQEKDPSHRFLPAKDSEPRGTGYDIDKAKSGWTSSDKLAGDPSKAAREAMKTVNRATGSYASEPTGQPSTVSTVSGGAAGGAGAGAVKFCGDCGAKQTPNIKFCGDCGKKSA